MNTKAIYAVLGSALMAVFAVEAKAQTKEGKESGRSIRERLFTGGMPSAAASIRPLGIDAARERSVRTPQELRTLIFHNYTPPGSQGPAQKGAAALQFSQRTSTNKLLSDSPVGDDGGTPTKPAVQTPPMQGKAKGQ